MRERFKNLKLAADIFPFLWTKEEKIRSLLVISFGLIFIAIGLDLGIPFILKKVVSSLSDSDKGMTYEISLLLVAYGGIWTLSQTIQQARLLIMVRPLERCIQIFCSKLFNHLHTLPMRFHLNRKTGAITNALERAQHGFPDVFCGLFLFVIPTLIELLLAVLILSYCYGAAYGLILLFISFFFLVFILYSTEWAAHFQTLSNEKQSEANANIVDSLLNFASVKYFNNKDHEVLKCNHHLKEREKLLVKSISSMEFVRIGQSIIIGLGLILLTYMAGRQALSSGYDISDFVLINGYILQFVSPLSHLGFIANEMRKGINDLRNAIEIYKNKPMPSSQAKEFPLKGRLEKVEFKKVSFGYDENQPILKEVSFCLQAGQTLGIVGTTGAGKSTISNLLFKFYDVKSGKILINDEDIQKLNSDSLYGHLGVVPQDIVLFNASIYENILFARPNAHKREVEEVIELAHLGSVLKKLPNHLNTIVGERGLKLSGGEKQRIAIARVLLKQPALYIFDEATSSLDLSTEEIIMNNIAPVIKNSTSIIIAHRLSTILNADKIIVLHNGYVAEQGTHTTLLKKNGIYTKLWTSHAKAHKRPSAS